MKYRVSTMIIFGFILVNMTLAQSRDPHNLVRWNTFDVNKLSTKFSNTNVLASGTNQPQIFPGYPPSMEFPVGSGLNYAGGVTFVVGGRRQADAGGKNPHDWPYFDSGAEEGPFWTWDPHHFQSYTEYVNGDRTPMSDDEESWPNTGSNNGWPAYLPNHTYLTMQNLLNLVPNENNNLSQIPIEVDPSTGWPGAGKNGEQIGDQESFSVAHTVNYVAEKEPGETERWLNVQTISRGMAWRLPKYEDMIFWKFIVRNMGETIEDCLIGIYNNYQFVADFQPFGGSATGGESGEDILYWDPERQAAYGTDFNGSEFDTRGNYLPGYEIAWGGTVVLKTPNDQGVTRFDAFDGLKLFSTPDENGIFESQQYFYNLLNQNDPDDPNGDGIDEGPYYNAWANEWNDYKFGYTYNIMAAGPFDMQPGELDTLIVATVFGQSKQDLLTNIDNAIALYKLEFKVPKPPPAPKVTAIEGDRKITLRWKQDSEVDSLFEGYKIYRSIDFGANWSNQYATDENGTPIVPIPLDQFDMVNGVTGISEKNPLFDLGNDTGFSSITKIDDNGNIYYEWTDYEVTNNYTYRYWVSAYSRGNEITEPLETPAENNPSLENDNTVEVTPASPVATASLDLVKVVPNPYKATASWESEVGVRKISFTGLPQQCTITIYNVAGELVKTIVHNDYSSFSYWDLLNDDNQEVAPGLYFYHVNAGELGSTVGKFVIIL